MNRTTDQEPRARDDLRAAQQASLARPRYAYSWMARLFFFGMDLLTGSEPTLPKIKLLEMLASIPYRAYEARAYREMTRHYQDDDRVARCRRMVAWSREAQDNEYWHLLVAQQKMEEEGLKDPWYLAPIGRSPAPLPLVMVGTYRVLSTLLATLSLRRALHFNAEFEDHAEHEYARFVEAHPEWEQQPLKSLIANPSGDLATWADVFRQIGLDERAHRDHSFTLAGEPEHVVDQLTE